MRSSRRALLLVASLAVVAATVSGCAAALTYLIADQINRNWDDWFNKGGDGGGADPEDYHVYLNGYDMGALSGGSGNIHLAGAGAGTYLVGVTKPTDRSTGTHVVAALDSNGNVDVSGSNIIEGGRITGTVRRADTGAVVPFAQVTAVKDAASTIAGGSGPIRIPPAAGATHSYMMAIANAAGTFTLGPALYGNWLVTAALAGYAADVAYVSISSNSNAQANLNLTVDGTAATGLVRGSVTRDGSPLSGALLSGKLAAPYQPVIAADTRTEVSAAAGLSLPAGPWFEWSTLVAVGGTDGQYVLDLPVGNHSLEALHPGSRAATVPVAITAGGSVTQNFALVAP